VPHGSRLRRYALGAVEVGHDVVVGIERHRRRVAGPAGDLDDRQALGDDQRAEGMRKS
jgi:hypothetical protein